MLNVHINNISMDYKNVSKAKKVVTIATTFIIF